MPGNATARFSNVALLSVASVLPTRVTTSDDIETRLAPSLARLRLRKGLLKRVAGVLERRNWAAGESADAATIAAGERALAAADVAASDVGLLINTSVTRRNLEPSVAVALHTDSICRARRSTSTSRMPASASSTACRWRRP